MFKPTSAKDRVNYGEALLPPPGYRLECAIGTTYSLDMETMTAVSIALGLIEDTDSELIDNPIGMLNALQKVSDKITVFCEAGQIKLPSKTNALCLMLEKMIVPVKLPFDHKLGRFPAFHPKMWMLEYSDGHGDWRYRLVIMSRNMTFDHSWDVACAMDGAIHDEISEKSQPLVAFLQYLKKQIDKADIHYKQQISNLKNFIEIIPKVWFDVDERFHDYDILPLGIGNGEYKISKDELITDNFHELVIMSPFLTGSIIEKFNQPDKNLTGTTRTLITRRSELSKISPNQVSNFDIYVMKDDIIDGESAISDGEGDIEGDNLGKQDIHAKIYLRRKNNSVDIYLGSMNASFAAMNSNIELLVKLKTRDSIFNGRRFLDDVMGEDRDSLKNPFEIANVGNVIDEKGTDPRDEAEKIIKQICRLRMSAEVMEGEQKYDVTITVNGEIPCAAKIRPFSSNREKDLMPITKFESLLMLQLSEFYILSVSIDDCTVERVIMIPTSGLPDGRDAEVIKTVIRDKKSFIEYIAFILGDDYVQSFLENKGNTNGNGRWGSGYPMPAVYEKMLKTSLSDPDRLGEIQYITQIIEDEDVIPVEFREMYKVFRDTLKIK